MVLGVCLGDFKQKEFKNFGEIVDPRARGEMLDETLEIIAGLQMGEKSDNAGTGSFKNWDRIKAGPLQ
jgi:hypothetical protein